MQVGGGEQGPGMLLVMQGAAREGAPARTLSSALPMNLVARREGHHRLNSFIQLDKVDLGTMTMWGPLILRYSWRYPSSEMVCSVLPSPCMERHRLLASNIQIGHSNRTVVKLLRKEE